MQAWPLTGRVEELQVIADVLSGDGEYTGVAIAGAAGVGKTRLAREAVAAASRVGWSVRWVVGTVAARSIPLGAFAQWADRLAGGPLQLVGGVIAAIATSPSSTPVLVAVDDAHLLDDQSAFVLHQVVLRGVATVIATIRTGEPAPDAVSALWKDAHLRRLDLQPLSRRQSDTLLEAALGGPVSAQCAERMWRLTRGNALFLRQLVTQELNAGRLITTDTRWQWLGAMVMSPSLVDLVDLYIGAAPEPVLEVIDLVAVAEPLELVYLAMLAEPEAIEEAERHALITVLRTSPTDTVRLGHPLYGEVRLAQSGRLRLARMRGRIAAAMTGPDQRVGPPDPVRRGLLWLDSDLPPDPVVFNLAAQAAVMRLDMAGGQRLAEAAVAAGAGVDAQLLHAHALSLLSRAEEAEELLSSLTARQLPDAAWSTAVHLRAANLLWSLARPEESWKVIDDALAASSGHVSAGLQAFRAVQLATAARPTEVLATCESIDRCELAALPALISVWALTIALGDLGRPLQATTVADEGAALAATSPDAAFQAVPLTEFHVEALVLGGYVSQALTIAERIYQQCADVPGISRAHATAIHGLAALANGDLPTARECLCAALTEFELLQNRTGLIYLFFGVYAEALARAGDIDAALHALTQMHRNRHPAYAFVESNILLATAWVAAARGRTTEARTLAAEAAEYARTHGQYAREVLCLQAGIQFGDHHNAGRLGELAKLVEGPRADLAARWAAALADDDGDALLDASRDLETMGDRIAAADAAAHASLAFHRDNRRGAALTASGRAGRLVTDCGASTPATRAAAMPLPLSSREREIAALVSDGLSNRAIAEALTVSVRTVENHIYRACSHLGVATRVELARLMTEFVAADDDRIRPDANRR